jgi:hypothetical protein
MSVEQLESQVLALPLAQRRAFTRWLDEHILWKMNKTRQCIR